MQRLIKTFFCALILAVGWQQARGYALLGPPAAAGDTWETPSIGYDIGGDVGTPKNIGQGYRRNIPVMYYAYDSQFADYFGVDGERSVDGAFSILNNMFTNNASSSLDGYSLHLSEFPDDSQSINYTAESLALTDLKSDVLLLMMEQLGLAQPERFTWTLHDRFLPAGGKCPLDEEYLVIQRNYDDTLGPLQIQYSPYVNDTLYTYEIEEFCAGPPPLSVTVPIAVDPYANTYTAVAGLGAGLGVTTITSPSELWASVETGGFYTGLTRDDVAGLRYLMTSNNIVFEDPGLGSLLELTNFTTLNPLVTANAATLLEFAQTNPEATVLAAFPTLQINSVSNYFTVVSNPIVVAYFTNYIGSPVGTPPSLVIYTNGYTLALQENFSYTFGNVVFVHYSPNTVAQLQTITLSVPYGAPVGTPAVTNVTYQTITLTNVPSGDYYIIPPGSCGFDIVGTLWTNNFVGTTTNVLAAATNTATGFVGSENIVTSFTNDAFEYYTCTFTAPPAAYYQGIGHIQFVRVPDTYLDPLTENFIQPITNTYNMVWYDPTNSHLYTQTFQRIVTTPDYLFTAEDLATPANGVTGFGVLFGLRNVNFDQANILPGLAGPGTINPATTFTFNEVGNIFANGPAAFAGLTTNAFLSQVEQGSLLAWASFDGTTNPPEVYPNGTSIQELENQLVISISPTSLPDGTNGVAYPTTDFTATGGQPPYIWSLAGTQLPQGLVFFNGVISGTPANNPTGVYDFNIELTDQDNRSVTVPYTITIH